MNLWPLILLVALVLLDFPVAYALMLSSLFYFGFFNTGMSVVMLFQRMIAQCESFTLLAVPFFVTAGVMMEYSGVANHMLNFADLFTGKMRGGLAQVNVLLSTLMGGCSGSANADAAMEAKMLVPEMTKRGYDPAFSAGITATSACITPIIPPGITLILYATLAGTSVSDMFLAGYLPGALMCAALMLTVSIVSKRKGYLPTRDRWPSLREIGTTTLKSVWALFIPLGLLMGLRIGMFTPTEGGAIVFVYCVVIGFLVYRQLKVKMLPRIFLESLKTTANIMFIIAGAAAFSYYLSWERIPQLVSATILGLTTNKYVFLLIINIFLLICGMFLEGTASTIILVPLLISVVQTLGINPVHFGIIFAINIQIGGTTPPFGTFMFTTCAATGVSIQDYTKKTWPFILALIITLLLVTYIPQISLLLPNL